MVRALAGLACLVCLAVAADPPAGVEPGQTLPGPFNAFVVTGGPKPKSSEVQTEERQNFGDPSRANKFHCLVTRYGLDPVVAVFSREAPPAEDQPLAKLLKSLDTLVDKNRNARLHAFAIFLRLSDEFLKDETRIPQINAIKDFATKLDLKDLPLAIDQAESERTKAYKIAAGDAVTVLVYEDHKVKNRFVFTAEKPLDDAGVKAIEDAVKAMIKK
jgi:hypothetical protein